MVQTSLTIASVALGANAGLEGDGGLPFEWMPVLALGTVALTAVSLKHPLRGRPGDVKRFLHHARASVPPMRRPIDREDDRLFPWVERILTTNERGSLQEAFDAAVRTEGPPGTGQQARKLAGRRTEGSRPV
jgi:hypothetical protein